MSSVASRSAHMEKVGESWPMVHALLGGTAAIRACGKQFLPQWPNEPDDSYKTRLSVATLYPAFRRTVEVNAAKPFSRPATVVAKGIPPEWLQNVDLQGSTLEAFANSMLVEALAFGLAGILVDCPPAEGVKSRAQEKAANVRPYFVKYSGQNILGWKIKGQKLVQLRLAELVEEDDGEFGTVTVEQVRVLTPGAWKTYRQTKDDRKEWVPFQQGTTTLKEIPWVFVYGVRIGFGHAHSPLKDLAYLNVEHYQSSSDQQTILHVARVPVLFGKCIGEDTEITIGAGSAIVSDSKDADLGYVEHTGEAIGAGRQSILDLEDRMRATGADLISQKPVQTTATQINAEGDSSKSVLQQIVENLEESISIGLVLMGKWISVTVDPQVEFYKSFTAQPPASNKLLGDAVDKKVISRQTMFEELQRRDVISLDRKWDDEIGRVAAERDGVSDASNSKPGTGNNPDNGPANAGA